MIRSAPKTASSVRFHPYEEATSPALSTLAAPPAVMPTPPPPPPTSKTASTSSPHTSIQQTPVVFPDIINPTVAQESIKTQWSCPEIYVVLEAGTDLYQDFTYFEEKKRVRSFPWEEYLGFGDLSPAPYSGPPETELIQRAFERRFKERGLVQKKKGGRTGDQLLKKIGEVEKAFDYHHGERKSLPSGLSTAVIEAGKLYKSMMLKLKEKRSEYRMKKFVFENREGSQEKLRVFSAHLGVGILEQFKPPKQGETTEQKNKREAELVKTGMLFLGAKPTGIEQEKLPELMCQVFF